MQLQWARIEYQCEILENAGLNQLDCACAINYKQGTILCDMKQTLHGITTDHSFGRVHCGPVLTVY